MVRFSDKVRTVLLAFGLAGCHASVPPQHTAAAPGVSPPDELNRIVEQYWDDNERLNPFHLAGNSGTQFGNTLESANSAQALADSLALERRYLTELAVVPRAALDSEAALTYDLFRRQRVLAAESYRFPAELLPVNPYDGVPQRFALAASSAARMLSSAKDFAAWREQTDAFRSWTRQAVANMRDGMRRGYTLPRVLVEKTVAALSALEDGGAATAESAANDGVSTSYRTLRDFLRTEYLPRARDTVGLSALPLGESWYRYLVKRETGTSQTPQELHALGVAEIERLHGRLQVLLSEASFAGNAATFLEVMRHDPRFAYKTSSELLAAVQESKAQTGAAVPLVFSIAPRMDFDIRSGDVFNAKTATLLSYVRVRTNGKTSAYLYVNTSGLNAWPATAVTARYLREAVPGRHFLLSMDHERTNFPRFRRFGGEAAFIEGWGLYATTLGEEMGMYVSAESKFGALVVQLTCAAALVIDTGLHAEGWTRQRALDYVRAQVPLDDVAAENMVDREIALPGDGLACTVGERRIQAAKARAQQFLGARFDIKAFHEAILSAGAVPLDMLDVKLKSWMEALPRLD